MTKAELLDYCKEKYGTYPDFPFSDDLETAVLRHADSRKWYALVMNIPVRRLGLDSDAKSCVVNLKLPTEMFGSFTPSDGVYPAYHMNKLHWISLILCDADDDTVRFLVNASFESTETAKAKHRSLKIKGRKA